MEEDLSTVVEDWVEASPVHRIQAKIYREGWSCKRSAVLVGFIVLSIVTCNIMICHYTIYIWRNQPGIFE